jgi:hypothetical protein
MASVPVLSSAAGSLPLVLTVSLDTPAQEGARLLLSGHLDAAGARGLLRAAADLVRGGCPRLVVDLDGVTSYDDEAAYAVAGCWRLARYVPLGVAVLAEGEVARTLAGTAGVPEQGIMGPCPAC